MSDVDKVPMQTASSLAAVAHVWPFGAYTCLFWKVVTGAVTARANPLLGIRRGQYFPSDGPKGPNRSSQGPRGPYRLTPFPPYYSSRVVGSATRPESPFRPFATGPAPAPTPHGPSGVDCMLGGRPVDV